MYTDNVYSFDSDTEEEEVKVDPEIVECRKLFRVSENIRPVRILPIGPADSLTDRGRGGGGRSRDC